MMRSFNLLVVLCASLVLGACSSQPAEPTPTALIPASIQLSWVHEYSSAPFHTAVREGLFTANGIEPSLLVGGFSEAGYIDPVTEVLAGTVDFGMASSPTLIEAIAQDKPVVGVANILQRSPLALMALDPSIQTPQDLVGKRLMATEGGARNALNAFLAGQGISQDDVTILDRVDFGVDPLVNGEVDALMGWRINEGVSLEEQGLEPVFFLMSDYGVDVYEFVLFTSQETAAERPDYVQAVVNSVLAGGEAVAANPAQAIEHTLSFSPDLDADAQRLRLEATIPLMRDADRNISVGMNPDVWAFSYSQLVAGGTLTEGLDITSAYTLQFVSSGE